MATITVSRLKAFDGTTFTATITGLGTASDAVSTAQGTVSGAANQMFTWQSKAGERAIDAVSNLAEVAGSMPDVFSDAQDTISAFVAAVCTQQDAMNSAIATAQGLGCTVADDGTVSTVPGEPSTPNTCTTNEPVEQIAADAEAQRAWQDKAKKAQQAQQDIQAALRKAAAADSRASSDLSASVDASRQSNTIIAGKDTTGAAFATLQDDVTKVNDGSTWVLSYVKKANSLINSAATGDTGSVKALQDMRSLSYDQDFAAAMMITIGAKNLEKLPYIMGQHLQSSNPNSRSALDALVNNNQSVLGFLADSLATASSSSDLDPTFLQQLMANGPGRGSDDVPEEGYWGLGQILGATTGRTTFDPQFLATLGTSMLAADKHWESVASELGPNTEVLGPFTGMSNAWANNLNLPANANLQDDENDIQFGRIDTGSSPVYGLLHAASQSPQASLAFLSSGSSPNANLDYLMTRHWPADKGTALGQTIAVAGDQPGKAADNLTQRAVADYTKLLVKPDGNDPNGQPRMKTISYNGGGLSGINSGMGQLLGYHADQLYGAYRGWNSIFPSPRDGLTNVLAAVGTDPKGYTAVMAGVIPEIKQQLIEGGQNGTDVNSRLASFQGAVGFQSQFLGYVVGAHNAGLAAIGHEQDAQAAANSATNAVLGKFISQGIGLIPVPGGSALGTLAKSVLSDVVVDGSSLPAAAPSYQSNAVFNGAESTSDASTLLQQIVGSTMVDQHLYTASPQAFVAQHGGPAFYNVGPNGDLQIIPPSQMTSDEYQTFQHWASGGPGANGDQGSALGSVGESQILGSLGVNVTANQQTINGSLGVGYPGATG